MKKSYVVNLNTNKQEEKKMENMKEKKMKEMERPVKAVHEQPVQDGPAKKPYQTPSLTKLGTVRELTQGDPPALYPDDSILSN